MANSDFSLHVGLGNSTFAHDTFTPQDGQYIVTSFIRVPSGTVCNNLVVYPQIEFGSKKTPYKKYQEDSKILYIQQEMLEGDYFIKETDGWKEVHNWTKIDSYNSESITTDYISTTGELTTGATIYYKLATPTKLLCTEAQSAVLEELNNLELFDGVNNIITAENIALLQAIYTANAKKYVDKEISDIKEQINTINELLSTTGTSSLLLDNLQSDLESEVM